MSGPRWDDEMKFELFRLKSELRSENFRVLATPLGLGRITQDPSQARRPEKSLYPRLGHIPEPVATKPSQVLFPTPGKAKSPHQLSPIQSVSAQDMLRRTWTHETEETDLSALAAPLRGEYQSSLISRVGSIVLAHVIDMLFVGLCLALGFVVLVLILDPAHLSLAPDGLLESVPMQVLRKIEVWTLCLGVYLVFALYWLFFRLVSGITLGESCVNNFRLSEGEMAAAPGNASTET